MAALSKLTQMHVAIIGSVLTVLVAAGIFFFMIKPLQERKKIADQKYETAQPIADARKQAEQERLQAIADVKQALQQWRGYEAKFMPYINIDDSMKAMQQRWMEQSVRLGPILQRFALADHKIQVTAQSLSVPAPPTDPGAMDTKVIVLPLGSVSVQGSFQNLLNNVERWNHFQRLVLVDGLNLTGYSPTIAGQYTLTCFIFTRGAKAGDDLALPGAAGAGGVPGMPGAPGAVPGVPAGGPSND